MFVPFHGTTLYFKYIQYVFTYLKSLVASAFLLDELMVHPITPLPPPVLIVPRSAVETPYPPLPSSSVECPLISR
jgi:hypothetical protein